MMKTFLISAYACEPDKGSEPGVGFNWAIELAKSNKVIVITRCNNKLSIDKYLESNKCDNLSFEYCDVPKKLSFWKKGQRGLHLYYCLWQHYCYKLAKQIVAKQKIDYALTVTFGNIWLPTFMHRLPCKFIWGPVGGGECISTHFWSHLNIKTIFVEITRRFNRIIPVSNIWFRSICKKSELIIVRTNDTIASIPKKCRHKCIIIIETGISQNDVDTMSRQLENERVDEYKNDYVISGSVEAKKMICLGIDAYNAVKDKLSGCRLHIVGSGPKLDKAKQLVKSYGLEEKIIFHGRKTRQESLQIMASCKALVITSPREGGSWVMFEAMLLKKPIICIDCSGMSVVITNKTGIMIPVGKYDEVVSGFAKAFATLQDDNAALMLGNAGYERVTSEFMWKNKIDRTLSELNK